jgi:hypothetical protein
MIECWLGRGLNSNCLKVRDGVSKEAFKGLCNCLGQVQEENEYRDDVLNHV